MNRRDYAAHLALRDTARMDRGHAYAVAVPVYRPRRKRAPARARARALLYWLACTALTAFAYHQLGA